LNTYFVKSRDFPWNILPNPYYWQGNEHNLFAVWSFAWTQRHDLMDIHSRWQLDHKFTSGPEGIPGNNDYGTMSSWFVFASFGIFPLAGSELYIITSPALKHCIFQHSSGSVLEIVAHNNSKENVIVSRVNLNGLPWTSRFIRHQVLFGDSSRPVSNKLEFWMTKPTLI